MTTKTENYIVREGLVRAQDPEIDNPIYRRSGFGSPPELGEMDLRIGEELRTFREKKGLARPDLAPLLGLTTQVYGRYERGEAKMHVTRLVHLCELLGFSPLELVYGAAPHLLGNSQEEAEIRGRLLKHIEELPLEKAKLLLGVVEAFMTASDTP
jgi:transcriptional regulator with XRE-family HTH domain